MAQIPGCERYILGCLPVFEVDGGLRRFATRSRLEYEVEVSVRMSVRRLDDLYAEGAARPWMSAVLKVEA